MNEGENDLERSITGVMLVACEFTGGQSDAFKLHLRPFLV